MGKVIFNKTVDAIANAESAFAADTKDSKGNSISPSKGEIIISRDEFALCGLDDDGFLVRFNGGETVKLSSGVTGSTDTLPASGDTVDTAFQKLNDTIGNIDKILDEIIGTTE